MAVLFRYSGYLLACKDTIKRLHTHNDCVEIPEKDVDKFTDNCDLAILEKEFLCKSNSKEEEVVIGGVYRHFKGKTVKVIAVSKNSENPADLSVVYECSNGVYHRPLDMFLSDVDKEKYPDVEQEKRFEFVCKEVDVNE